MADFAVGKAKFQIRQRGCVRCGTENSYYWRVVQTIKVTVETNNKHLAPIADRPVKKITRELTLSACGRCCGVKEPR